LLRRRPLDCDRYREVPGNWKVTGAAMKIGELAARSGVPAKTIRYWEAEGLMPQPERTTSGYRDYDAVAADRARFIRRAQASGLTLAQIRQVLDISDEGNRPCEHVGTVVGERLAEVEARLAELRATRAHLRRLAERAAAQDPAECRGLCSIIIAET
jgi:DNA-binding transcriptional MerR regulator